MEKRTFFQAIKLTLRDHKEELADAGDKLLSVITEDGVLDELPVIGTGVKILKARDAYQEHKFRRNCVALLQAFSSGDNVARDKVWSQLSADDRVKDDFADTFLLIASESAKPLKAEVVGRLIAALLDEQICYERYQDLVLIVHSASIPALRAVPLFFDRTGGDVLSREASSELEPLLLSLGITSRFGTAWRISELGKDLHQFGFGGSPEQPT